MLVVSVAIAAVFADNLMTLAIAWATLDLVAYFWVVLSGGGNRVAGELGVNLLAVALVMVAALVCAAGGNVHRSDGTKLYKRSNMIKVFGPAKYFISSSPRTLESTRRL